MRRYIWLYILSFADHPPVLDSEWPTYAACAANFSERRGATDEWVSGCIELEHDDWPTWRPHR